VVAGGRNVRTPNSQPRSVRLRPKRIVGGGKCSSNCGERGRVHFAHARVVFVVFPKLRSERNVYVSGFATVYERARKYAGFRGKSKLRVKSTPELAAACSKRFGRIQFRRANVGAIIIRFRVRYRFSSAAPPNGNYAVAHRPSVLRVARYRVYSVYGRARTFPLRNHRRIIIIRRRRTAITSSR